MRYLSILLLLGCIFNNPVSYANGHAHSLQHETLNSTVQVMIENAPSQLTADQTETLHLKLLKDNKPLSLKDLKTVHTEKIHLMAIDPTLTDYHHIHPVMDNKNKDFVFKFTPKKSSSYRIWVDITPIATNKQIFLKTDIGSYSKKKSYCQIWCMPKISSGGLPVCLFNNLYPVFKLNVINNKF